MTWGELDLEDEVWTVPAGRIKAGREHRVPLAGRGDRAAGRTGRARPTGVSEPDEGREAAVGCDVGSRARAHGLRRSPCTVSARRSGTGPARHHPPARSDRGRLGPRLKDKAEAAYARGDLFQKRRRLMQDWADYLASAPAAVLELNAPQSAAK